MDYSAIRPFLARPHEEPMSRLRPQDAEARAQRAIGADFSEALARGLGVIGAFDDQRRQMTLSDVARAVDLPRATVRRSLATLVALGYVEADGRLFRLTPRILKLAIAYLSSDPVPSILQPVCERLCRQVGASCSVAVRDGEEAVMIARAVPARPASVGLGVGYRLPVFCSALGRVLASAMPDAELDAFLAQLKPVRFTRQTVVSKPEIRRLILDVRKKGYSLADQEAEIGIRSIAVPLVRFDGKVVAALNIGVQPEQVSAKAMITDYVPLLTREALALRERLV
jgi:IclR family transcriptional regulator, pca regulon regulatory protein